MKQYYDLMQAEPKPAPKVNNAEALPPMPPRSGNGTGGKYYQSMLGGVGMKDYSKDSNVNDWGQVDRNGNLIEMGPVALQAQGYSLPVRERPPQPSYPMGVSIT